MNVSAFKPFFTFFNNECFSCIIDGKNSIKPFLSKQLLRVCFAYFAVFLIGYGQPTFCIFNLSRGLLIWFLFYLLSCQVATLASFCCCRGHHILFYSAVDCTLLSYVFAIAHFLRVLYPSCACFVFV